MKGLLNIASLLVLLAMFSTTGYAQSDQPAAEKPVDNSCFQLIGDENYSFGTVDQNETVEHVFEFKNNCDRIININSARASCGCTAAVLSDKEIKPGGLAKINVKFTPPRMSSGKVTKTVSLYIEGDSRPHTVIRFSADVKSDLVLNPRHISLRGAIIGEKMTEHAKIKNMTEKTITIPDPSVNMYSYTDTSSVGNRPAVAIQLKNATVSPTPIVIEPGKEVEVTVTFTPEYKGQLNGNVRFKTDKTEAWLQIYGVVREKPGDQIHPQGDVRAH